MARVLIVANGVWPEQFNFERSFNDYSQIIALDGAANRLIEQGHLPDVIIGDFDSIEPSVLKDCKERGSQIVLDANQEQSDVSKGLNWAHEHHPTSQIYLIGIEIGRYDHHLAGYSALFECESSAILLLDGWEALRIDSTPREFQVRDGGLFSLIPFGAVTGVKLHGCRYPLDNETLSSGTRGVSNEAVDSVITASAQSGDLLLLIER